MQKSKAMQPQHAQTLTPKVGARKVCVFNGKSQASVQKEHHAPMPQAILPKIKAIQEVGKIGLNHLETKEKAKARKVKARKVKVVPHGEHQVIHLETVTKEKAKARKVKAKVKANMEARVLPLQVQLGHGTHKEVPKLRYANNTLQGNAQGTHASYGIPNHVGMGQIALTNQIVHSCT